jgi:DNA repair photolyase
MAGSAHTTHPDTSSWFDRLQDRARSLRSTSPALDALDLEGYRDLAKFHDPAVIETVFSDAPFKSIAQNIGCGNCHQALQLDTYARGCLHDCSFCFAKEQAGTEWNQPYPIPIDITSLWSVFQTVFETDHSHPMREILEKRIPIRIGGLSDGFMAIDRKFKVSLETLKLFCHYQYPFSIVTRSDLVAQDDYLKWIPPQLATVHFSISSLNERLTRQLEPGSPSPERRLQAMRKLSSAGVWTIARISPLFPRYPDGHYSNGHNGEESAICLDYFDFDLIPAAASAGAGGVLTGFLAVGGKTMADLSRRLDFDLSSLLRDPGQRSGFEYSKAEIRAYFEKIRSLCHQNAMEFTSCYLGGGEESYFENRALWDNKKDCCNMRDRVEHHRADSRGLLLGGSSSRRQPDANLVMKALEKLSREALQLIFRNLNRK